MAHFASRAKRGIALLLTCMITCQLVGTTFAIEENPFKDVSTEKYYYEPIISMYEAGVMSGYGNGYFGPDDNLTHAQVLVMLARLCKIDLESIGTGEIWYSSAAEWAELRLGLEDVPYGEPVTRGDVGKYIIKAYKLEEYLETTQIDEDKPFTDTDADYAEVLYDLGVAAGFPNGDGTVSFGVDQLITRGQAATFFNRILAIENPEWLPINIDEHTQYLSTSENTNEQKTETGHLDHTYYNSIKLPERCNTYDDLYDLYTYMMIHHISEVIIGTDFTTNEEFNKLKEVYRTAYKAACTNLYEYASFNDGTSMKISRNTDKKIPDLPVQNYVLNITLRHDYPEDEYIVIIEETEKIIHEVIEDMYKNSILNDDMSSKDKAKAVCEWIVKKFKYDITYTNYTSYELLRDNTATCSGYTALYTAICRHIGIPIKVQRGEAYSFDTWGAHIWNYIDNCEECGKTHYIDVTWCDPIPNRDGYISYKWFWVDEENWTDHKAEDYCQINIPEPPEGDL